MSEIDNFIVFGSERPVGQNIVQRGLLEGLEVRAFVPDDYTVPNSFYDGDVDVIHGDVLNKQQVVNAIKGCDAVLSAIDPGGWFGNTAMMERAIKNIISGMKTHGVTKLAILSNANCLPAKKGFFTRLTSNWSRQQGHVQVLRILQEESGSIDWIAMMAPKIVNNPKVNQEYKVERNNMPGQWSVTSGELADFMVKVFMDRTSRECFTHNKLGISSQPKARFRFLRWLIPVSFIFGFLALAFYRGIDLLPLPLREFIKNTYSAERSQGVEEPTFTDNVLSFIGWK